VGGGIVHGPKPRSYSVKVNKKMRAAALRSALADKANDGLVWILDGFGETKTKAAAGALNAADIKGRVLIVLDPDDESSRSVDRAFRNLDKAAFTLYGSLATYDVLVADAVIFMASAFDKLSALVKEGRS
jgi:large subunit ribosomal protein L4